MDESFRIFLVEGEFFNKDFSISVPFRKFMVARSADDAIQQVLRRMEEQREQNIAEAERLTELEAEGKINLDFPDPRTAFNMLAIGNTQYPWKVEQWRATSVEVPGYRIIPEPEATESAPQAA